MIVLFFDGRPDSWSRLEHIGYKWPCDDRGWKLQPFLHPNKQRKLSYCHDLKKMNSIPVRNSALVPYPLSLSTFLRRFHIQMKIQMTTDYWTAYFPFPWLLLMSALLTRCNRYCFHYSGYGWCGLRHPLEYWGGWEWGTRSADWISYVRPKDYRLVPIGKLHDHMKNTSQHLELLWFLNRQNTSYIESTGM